NPLEELFCCLKIRYDNKRPQPNYLNIFKQSVTEVITVIITDVDFRYFCTHMLKFMD
ncbi:hypothetical protein MXB_1428, partial [Myxobolus squamalis]